MVTCRLSQMIELEGDEAVGSGVTVAVGEGVRVAVAVTGVDDDPFLVEQEAIRNRIMNRVGKIFFMGTYQTPSNSNT